MRNLPVNGGPTLTTFGSEVVFVQLIRRQDSWAQNTRFKAREPPPTFADAVTPESAVRRPPGSDIKVCRKHRLLIRHNAPLSAGLSSALVHDPGEQTGWRLRGSQGVRTSPGCNVTNTICESSPTTWASQMYYTTACVAGARKLEWATGHQAVSTPRQEEGRETTCHGPPAYSGLSDWDQPDSCSAPGPICICSGTDQRGLATGMAAILPAGSVPSAAWAEEFVTRLRLQRRFTGY